MAFFDSNIDVEVKEEMVNRLMLDKEVDEDDELECEASNGHRVLVKPEIIESTYLTKKFGDFVPHTLNFFERFSMPTKFLYEPMKNWPFSESFKKGIEIVKQLKVTNNTAERSVQLMASFIGAIKKKSR